VLGVPKEDLLFVSSNSFDVVSAKAFGFNVTWVCRSGGKDPATMFGMLRGRAEELGHAPDHVVSALTDLPKLL
jgi:FMN phosphatase YigB (HAD superfamily)